MSAMASSSFTLPSLSTATPDPTSTAGIGTGNGVSSSLYLYTFLATLLVLLAISAFIIFRTVVQRRRNRAAILAAIADGTYIPPPPPPNLKVRPKMWEVYLDDENDVAEKGWSGVTPVSAMHLDEKSPAAKPTTPPPLACMSALLRRSHAPPEPTAPAPARDATLAMKPVQLAVLIAMPQPAREKHADDIPALEFGVSVLKVAES
ncbi:hypothetical protein BV25DRAFT_1916507 [Artomyces pyxidatus]|uniref:Uncharacterized protein n=1 Tax=Artomyces pyxidatus TaxID=48021 RepID=A0ACB8SZ88_9AGAM|nr:hypothetical protein BV25DRAFT_1916507 [Artomyces pyxidatus]